ncbi:hypothetical protein GS399_01755 [Pedobacter sp. HMF7647]|uniref:Uncharacterized protein n=1 Tax=Hufsiella arboris TaxID=2695275 RepID=A0A7K1Y5L7_9SPHI|nr:hypothetical protein [Hufsiella arboris]MXV49681.1 hypothetical protein [Hufsiella arboris]
MEAALPDTQHTGPVSQKAPATDISDFLKTQPSAIQCKLTVGSPDDPLEHEANDIADRVMRMPDSNFIRNKSDNFASTTTTVASAPQLTTSFIQRQQVTTSGATSSIASQIRFRPTGVMTRRQFDDYVKTYYGVADVHTGTQTEQEGRLTRHGVPAPTIPNWQSWDPGTASDDYTSIVDAMENILVSVGAMPQINRIIFFQMDYEPDPATGVGTPRTDTGASFGAGELVIYEAFNGTTDPATGRSTSAGTPLRSQSRSENIGYIITHELGHGIGEAASNGGPQMFNQYRAAVGWVGSPPVLYDIGQQDVIDAISNSTTPPAQYIITPRRWSDPTVIDQPMSRYSVAGGPGEDFAEAIAAYITNPSSLQQRSPARYNFINSNMAAWANRMRQTAPAYIRPPQGDFPVPSGDTRYA